MTTGLFYAHSGLRYLVLLVGVVAAVYFALGVTSRRAPSRADRILMSSYVGLLDLQLLLGIVLVATGIYYPALLGHMLTMLVAIVVAHGAAAMSRRGDAAKSHKLRLAGVVVSLLLIAAGITAIGRGIFQSGTPSM